MNLINLNENGLALNVYTRANFSGIYYDYYNPHEDVEHYEPLDEDD